MTDARRYLLDRFEGDAATLRSRAAMLQAATQKQPGPDAATSLRMAEACDRVAALVRTVRPADDGIMLQLLAALTIPLDESARENAHDPAVRAVYAGAATRIREMLAAERAPE